MADKWLCVQQQSPWEIKRRTGRFLLVPMKYQSPVSVLYHNVESNCLMSKLLQEHSEGSLGKKNTPFFLFYNTLRQLAMDTKCTVILKSP